MPRHTSKKSWTLDWRSRKAYPPKGGAQKKTAVGAKARARAFSTGFPCWVLGKDARPGLMSLTLADPARPARRVVTKVIIFSCLNQYSRDKNYTANK
jgi:hypothetical protein